MTKQITMKRVDYVQRRMLLKRQHITIIKEDIRDLEKELDSLSEEEKQKEIPL